MSDFLDRFFAKIAEIIDKRIKNKKLNSAFKKIFSREIVTYLVFGALTTAVNFGAYTLMKAILGGAPFVYEKSSVHIANTFAWIAAVVFAFFTNKSFVFESKSYEKKVFAREFFSFVGARVATFLIEEAGLFVMNTWLGWNDFLVKVIVAVAVIILNYVFSKILVFKRKK